MWFNSSSLAITEIHAQCISRSIVSAYGGYALTGLRTPIGRSVYVSKIDQLLLVYYAKIIYVYLLVKQQV